MTVPSGATKLNLAGGAWCIYVGRAAQGNFVIGREAKTWGTDQLRKLQGVKKGDRLIFVESLDGYGRKSSQEFIEDIGRARTIVEGIIASDLYEDPSPLWPDDTYPYRFKFFELTAYEHTRLLDVASHDVAEAIRLSGLKQGSAVYADGTTRHIHPRLPDDLSQSGSLDDLAAATFMDQRDLREIESLLLEKKQIVFEGPPGSGKTFLADKFARYFTGNPLDGIVDESVELVQFHQSYGYEDFVQGIRPLTTSDGSLQYRVQSGIFAGFCERAAANPLKRFVIVIDEINRGNISRIFGELLLLLEYRDKRVRLPYGIASDSSEAYMSIPFNVFIIGTMNSTDRSLALIDYALRRRFYFYRLLPVVDGRASVFSKWLAEQDIEDVENRRLLTLFLQLNARIREHMSEDFQIGHSYFMIDGIGRAEQQARVWRHAVMPLLAEYFHNSRNSEEILDSFAIEALDVAPIDLLEEESVAE
jgi:MoxR-like ATPase